jgi:hypothetical protein|tara:strand:+ start:732 stop:1880 length:1149 start_codon:yes stop_codon:yes gene_type:complete
MANIPIWAGSSSFDPGNTPFGFYDYDEEFRVDADKVAMFVTRRLGYPLVDVELQDISFYAAFEEAVTTYGNELYSYQIRDNQLSLEGSNTAVNLNNALLASNFEPIIRLTEMYGAEAGTGGNITYYSSSVEMKANQQAYDLTQNIPGGLGQYGIEVKKVFYESPPASVKFYDPYVGTGMGQMNMMESFGFGGMSPAINFLMMPLNYDLAIIQQIEMSDTIRRSNYSFEIQNNKLKIFPIPTTGSGKIWFEYIKRQDRIDSSVVSNDTTKVSNVSNTPYTNPTYKNINSVGRQWIFEYSLAISKEMLGYVRGKYGTIPIPDSQVTLNQSDLIAAATAEKTSLLERLRSYFDETSRKSLLERRAQEAEFKQTELKQVPYTIYIG